MKFIERYPNYVDIGTPREYDVYSLGELHEVPRVKDAMSWPDFYRLAVTSDEQCIGGFTYLMAETKEGYAWWAIGRFAGKQEEWLEQLPVWQPKYKNEQ